MKIAGISDIHGKWGSVVEDEKAKTISFSTKIDWATADVLFLAGDILSNYSDDRRIDADIQLGEIYDLNLFLGDLKARGVYKHIILVAGNHDWAFQLLPEAKEMLTNAVYLQDSGVEIDGVNFWGSPWQPYFWDWAFNFPQSHPNSKIHAEGAWGMIPDNTDVLITHSPPYGILDLTYNGSEIGCPYLMNRISALSLRLHGFGHVHCSYGMKKIGGFNPKPTIFMNVACVDGKYEPTNLIQVVEI